jgi:hypothetical protein
MSSQTWNRIDLAVEQLDTALMLLLEHHRYVAAITLAGAAEHLPGEALHRATQQPILGWKFEQTDLVHSRLQGQPLSCGALLDAESRVDRAQALRPEGFRVIRGGSGRNRVLDARSRLRKWPPAWPGSASVRAFDEVVLRTHRGRLMISATTHG